MKEFVVDKNSDGVRLDKYMSVLMPSVKFGEICKALRKKKVRVDGHHEAGTYRLSFGQKVCIYMNDEVFERPKVQKYNWIGGSSNVKIVYEDENIIIGDKPSGLLTQSDDKNDDSLENRIRSYLYNKGAVETEGINPFIPSVCHRIDRNTSGLVICAKNIVALREINERIKNKDIRKFYLCCTDRPLPQKTGEITGWLLKNERQRKMYFYDEKPKDNGAVYCKTLYRVLNDKSPYIAEAEILTGRTHQIRASFAHIGCPLKGDVKYGAKESNNGKKSYQQLKAYRLLFDFKKDGRALDYLAGQSFEI